MRKNLVRTYGVLAIAFVVFTVVVLALPFVKNAVFWVSYLFVLLAIGVQGYAIHAAFSKDEPVTSKLYGFPVARIGFGYLVGQTIASLIFMALAAILPLWVAIVVSVVALGAAGVGLITTDAMREEILRQDAVLKKDVSAMRAMQSKGRLLVGQCEDAAMKQQLNRLAEALQYSDPVTVEATAAMEHELAELMEELQKAVVEQEFSAAAVLCQKSMDMLAERNRLCKLNK